MSSEPSRKGALGLKKSPSQARGRERVDRILNATSTLLAEVGHGSMNTNIIAEKAGVPVGSIYQYFDGKDNIVFELTKRFEARIIEFAEAELSVDLLNSGLDKFLTVFANGLLKIQAADSAFICVFSGSNSDPMLQASADRLREGLVEHLYSVMVISWPSVPDSTLRRILLVWSELTKSLISIRHEFPRDELASDIVAILSFHTLRKVGPDISKTLQEAR